MQSAISRVARALSSMTDWAIMNVLSRDQQVSIIACLAEGQSIRATERLTGIHRDTIMRLGERVARFPLLDTIVFNPLCPNLNLGMPSFILSQVKNSEEGLSYIRHTMLDALPFLWVAVVAAGITFLLK